MYSSQELMNARPLLRSPLNSLGGDGLSVDLAGIGFVGAGGVGRVEPPGCPEGPGTPEFNP